MASSAQGQRDTEDDKSNVTSSRSQGDPVGSNVDSQLHTNEELGPAISMSNDSEYEPIMAVDRAELTRVASELKGVEGYDPALDPSGPAFDVYKWVKMVLRAAEGANIKLRRASITFKNLNVSGSGIAINLQPTVASFLLAPIRLREWIRLAKKPQRKILSGFEGLVKPGEMLLVLGRPGSGCSTLLKTLAGELHGLNIGNDSVIHYSGIPQHEMIKNFRGEIVYNAEVDRHFPHLTVRQTLEFAAAMRTPANRIFGESRNENVQRMTAVAMAVCGLSHVQNTRVGSAYVRGASGGERKRVSIAEMLLSFSPIGFWDNGTRGLDASSALSFVRTLRLSADLSGSAQAVAAYQASQAMYDVFDKVVVLYEGREIYLGSTKFAKDYFADMGWLCPPRQTTPDFLTSVTNVRERKPRPGYEKKVPRTAPEFEEYWRKSKLYQSLQQEIRAHEEEVSDFAAANEFKLARRAVQAHHVPPNSPYTVSPWMQIQICSRRGFQRLWNERVSRFTLIIGQGSMSLIIGSVFYGTINDTNSFFAKGSTIFFAILLNALVAVTEINRLYDQRPIVEKQVSYAFYHPFAEALATVIADLPVQLSTAVIFNVILYFLAGLRREAAQFFIFFLFAFLTRLAMTGLFRTIGAATKTISQALAIAAVFVLAIVIYTGFTIPRPNMHPWFKWLSWCNPIAFSFEALLVNEFHGRQFPCGSYVPAYPNRLGDTFICSVPGSIVGQSTVSGDAYLETSYRYNYSHIWRNLGIVIAFLAFFMMTYLGITEINSKSESKGEVLLFRRGHVPRYVEDGLRHANQASPEAPVAIAERRESQDEDIQAIPSQKVMFTWRDVNYDIPVRDGTRRLLDQVSGWVKPGTLTALMGVSGAGKTTLLDVLAQRTSIGVITGDILANGKPLDTSFPRKTGYVQQQDLHLETSTVREALRFSAMLRQPKSVSKKEKYDYVEEVVKMLNMEDFAEAVVGVPGEGLNVEQRKLLTIGVELAAKPSLLFFLDEPTSGLDSQSSWSILSFLRKLADHGQAVLSTIHQPSAILFQEFDRLLFLTNGGRTVYFGDIGPNSQTLISYFERHGARHCTESENVAEYILEVVNPETSTQPNHDWVEIWKSSEENENMLVELERINRETSEIRAEDNAPKDHGQFAMPLYTQIYYTTIRAFQQYWRTPGYIWHKFGLGVASALFIGFSFWQSNSSQQGLQDVLFSVFMLTAIFTALIQQIIPRFVIQRSLYEVRERPSKAYSYIAFLLANIFVEIPYEILLGIMVYASYFYSVFGVQSSERQGLILLFCIQFFVYASTFSQMVIAALPDAETAGIISTLMFAMCMIFNGVLQLPDALPGFWLFMYRVSPFTYIIDGIVGTALHNRKVVCAENELSIFNPPPNMTCGQYLAPYLQSAPGTLYNPTATSKCEYCALSLADQYLSPRGISWSLRWRNFGLVWAYIAFDLFMIPVLYYTFRMRKWGGKVGTNKRRRGLNLAYARIHTIGRQCRRLLTGRREKLPLEKRAENARVY
ncbi:uncharacterized protein Z518_07839 [Rhinocladiella mackenziei CBS 650.93]|uniref:ABC transporter domain-containing protein n=1 Tax=Rhinocladiella mackenziei CBS 650.93 TaxID=1442369 RepID=A0A0D2IZ53_9EURO|nr:uncharacterized protein Z518_07839 [Rhinocladiella mackenziei CBS 650.93]KIX01900.1 hypothetical protein Z518_07839 [Rhinocladiella mackenziei CBS 650.93]